jgi:hypothetical protein
MRNIPASLIHVFPLEPWVFIVSYGIIGYRQVSYRIIAAYNLATTFNQVAKPGISNRLVAKKRLKARRFAGKLRKVDKCK